MHSVIFMYCKRHTSGRNFVEHHVINTIIKSKQLREYKMAEILNK